MEQDPIWTPHPLLPVPTETEQAAMLALPNGADELAEYYADREKVIRLSEDDPFEYGTEPDHWRDVDALSAMDILLLIIFGGNRAGKSEYAAKRIVQDAHANPDSVIFCFHENEKASIGLQQKYVWRYLPVRVKQLEGKTHPVYKVRYTQANGFTDGKIVFPNRSEIYFLTYGQKPGSFEGLELGAKKARGKLGCWADENMPLPWFNMLKLRLASRSAKLLWTYTPVNGITPVIKEVLGSTSKTVKSLPAELLADRVNLPGLPMGHMPYIVEPYMAKSRVVYFHSILNPFGDHYRNIKSFCEGRPSEYIERRAYGFARDVGQRAFPYFGSWNIIKREHLPAVGTNYMFTDPAGARNWATIWVRVAPGNPPKFYIYRDWPPEQKFGEWAVPTERDTTEDARRGWDGDPGPAQNSLGFGIVQYKRLFLEEERITLGTGNMSETDPYRASIIEAWRNDLAAAGGVEADAAGAAFQETVFARYIDPRAGKNRHAAEKGGTCLVDELAREQRNASGSVIGPAMQFRQASGVEVQEGLTTVNELLFWNKEEPLTPLVNEPRLFVSEDCRQMIWAMQNYTGMGGETGACKDFIDLVRYMALGRLRHVDAAARVVTGGGSY